MTLETVESTAPADGRGPEQPVPSYYALPVGDIDVVVISDGVLPMSAPSLATNADPEIRAAWLDDMFLPSDSLALPLNQVVVRRGEQTILIDAGVGVDYQDFTPRAGHWGERLEAAGIDLAAVTDVVLTHMHFDHVGGLLVDGVKDRLRPDVRIHAAAAEAEFWESPDFSRTTVNAAMQDAMRSSATRFLTEYRNVLRPFENEYEVAPGVLVRRTGGHTPGHSVVRLASGGDRLTFAGDAVLQAGFDHPDWFNGFEHDPEEAARVRVGLLQELSSTREALVATHLPFPSVCHVATAGNAFRCVPAVWES
ncbi:MBL fold metallo-hydrolase [Mycobacterium sp. 360MFTsu5.1]|uniref:MBL fold metallo-hydrolase n=1 Tax=Mycobacterium sp. 360MFTsu5.1 TaxID=1172186 RepID=UPI00037F3F9E|nr:MBL fold metallo-hydrolase [Mycobacterium sp. 360MFTsu5.1]